MTHLLPMSQQLHGRLRKIIHDTPFPLWNGERLINAGEIAKRAVSSSSTAPINTTTHIFETHRLGMPRFSPRSRLSRPPSISAVAKIALFAFISPWLWNLTSPYLSPYLPHALRPSAPDNGRVPYPEYECRPHHYSTELVSLDPLLIYIENFLRPSEITELLEAGESGFSPSTVFKNGRLTGTSDRTSSSAGLPRDNPTVDCVLSRAQGFMGSMMDPNKDDIGPPQLVRYRAGQLFNKHHDWYDTPQPTRRGMRGHGRTWNRAASFFAILEDHCKGGETWFPYIDNTHSRKDDAHHLWRAHEEGGLAFKPVAGNAIFWVNLHANGTGDDRTIHAGLTVTEGLKTAMNIWPRKFYD